MVFKYNKSATNVNFSVEPIAKRLTTTTKNQLTPANIEYLKSLGFKIKKTQL